MLARIVFLVGFAAIAGCAGTRMPAILHELAKALNMTVAELVK